MKITHPTMQSHLTADELRARMEAFIAADPTPVPTGAVRFVDIHPNGVVAWRDVENAGLVKSFDKALEDPRRPTFARLTPTEVAKIHKDKGVSVPEGASAADAVKRAEKAEAAAREAEAAAKSGADAAATLEALRKVSESDPALKAKFDSVLAELAKAKEGK